MSQVIQIGIAFTSIVILLFPIGFILKYFWPKMPWQLVPIFGLMIYGGIAVPLLYFLGRFSFVALDVIVALLVLAGLFFAALYVRKKTDLVLHRNVVLLAVLLASSASIMIVALARQPVPGGIDSAIHSVTMTAVETSGRLDVKYPLGMHTFVLFFEGLLHINRAYIMQAFAVFLNVNFFTLIFSLLKRISGKNIVGWLGVSAAVFDASFFNNLLNGSLTHILAVDLILCYLLYVEVMMREDGHVMTVLLVVQSIAVVYFHFISWYFVLPALWFHRLIARRQERNYLLTTAATLLLSIPLIVRLYDYLGYSEVFIWTTTLILGVEALLYAFGNSLSRFLNGRWSLLFLVGVAVALFSYYRNRIFFSFDQWYGWPITVLGIIGFVYLSIKRKSNWTPYMLLFGVYSVLFASFHWGIPIINKIGIIKELLFYYGFTVPLALFSAMGLYCFIVVGSSRRAQFLKLAGVSVIAVLVFASRMSDSVLVDGGNAISRYNKNDGFGIFYRKDDVVLANWFRENIRDASIVANPGGLYGVWTSMTGHPTVYLAYSRIDVPQAIDVNNEIIELMTNGESGRPEVLLSNNVRYLFVPQTVPADIAHPYLRLLKQVGTSRVYRIIDKPDTTDRVITLSPLLSHSFADVHLEGEYGVQSPLVGQAFFHQFQNIVQVIILGREQTVQLEFDPAPLQRLVFLKLRTPSKDISVFANDVPVSVTTSQVEELTSTITLPLARATTITIKNTGSAPTTIKNIIAQLGR